VRCHLGVVPQERTAEEHTTRGLPTIRAIFGRGTLGAMVSRGWSLWTVQCEGEMYLARTLTTNASQQRSSTNCWRGSMAGDVVDCSAAPRGSRFVAAYFVVTRGRKACPLPPPQHGGARSEATRSLTQAFAVQRVFS
jgi:hypothetical protein